MQLDLISASEDAAAGSSAPAAPSSEKRSFSVAPNIIVALIKSQAGSLGKAVVECVMNSIDAGASEIEITATHTKITISDNGRGFISKEEILRCFEVFGFDHANEERKFGTFGIGRGQLWNFAATLWRTNQHAMHVDVRKSGLDYELATLAVPAPGMTIEAHLYEPLATSELMSFEHELADLARYVQHKILFNGRAINTDAASEKWTHETDDAWIKISTVARGLTVYNLGIKVREYGGWDIGVGGVVVTKPGVSLKLNMARNDVITADCKVWKRIKPFLRAESDRLVERAVSLTPMQKQSLATRWVAGELDGRAIEKHKLITDVLGTHRTLGAFFTSLRRYGEVAALTAIDRSAANPAIEKSHKALHSFVLAAETLTRFGASDLDEFVALMDRALGRQEGIPGGCPMSLSGWVKSVPDPKVACSRYVDGYEVIAPGDLTRIQAIGLRAAQSIVDTVAFAISENRGGNPECPSRTVKVGISAAAQAWTDGASYVCFESRLIDRLKNGHEAFLHLANVAIHEMCHDEASTGTHVHGLEFYERYEAISAVGDEGWSPYGGLVGVMRDYFASLQRAGMKCSPQATKQIDKLELMAA